MMEQPLPFPWWLWILAGLWTSGIVLRCVWPFGREARWGLNVLIAVYTVLLAYMTAQATTASLPAVGLLRLGWWSCGAATLAGGLWCAFGTASRGRMIGWILATTGLSGLALWLRAPELALLCALAGIVGWLRRDIATRPDNERNDSEPRDTWLVAVTATVLCVAWLGSMQFALRTEMARPGVSPRLTALPAPDDTRVHGEAVSLSWPGLLLAGVVLGLTVIHAWPRRLDAEGQSE